MRTHRLERPEIVLSQAPVPEPGPGQLLVRVHAAALNKRDLLILDGTYALPARPGVIPVSDGAGEVVAAGPGVSRFRAGDRVMGSYWPRWHDGRLRPELVDQPGCTSDGMLTEYALLDEQAAVAVPEHLSWAEAATLPCAALTAWTSLTGGGKLLPGRTVVLLGTGGVSLFGVQLARLLGCRVIVTTSRAGHADRLKALGADHVIDYTATPQWWRRVRELTGGKGADLVVDTAGPATIDGSVRAAALYGEVVVLITRDDTSEHLAISHEAYASSLATLRRVFVGNRTDLEELCAAVAAAGLRPVIDRTFTDVRAAYRHYREGSPFGKVVIELGPA
ncbi:zinc-dependent alcohol dehydrogenase family protein [Nonomuraea gerenzanensis]|uniref:Alcohol dehydrogenase n=1 Tax=Nonomuraea gerenzanensis TaxID=93944 RepID=A0A1M4E304_9ACTN|nr:NAD(P)-dependent alcohol dehydrogenase [Nonomuraea gerenzanensis]UBU15440.1 NAD(P)-dependent alcohol dehydrogenase [Nonomuraea gerenzanensis]SBO93197.1 Alcohol dehydrogenase [Nonomuraea gerenzanensis]